MKKLTDVLCLNKSFLTIHVLSWQKAISLIYQEKARALDREFTAYSYQDWLDFSIANAESYYKVKGTNYSIALPEVIVSTSFNRLPERQVKYSRQSVFSRDKFTCAYCGKIFKVSDLTVDHIIPRAQGGKTEWDNVIASCFKCNQNKADRTPRQAGLKLHFRPTKPGWCSPLHNVNFNTHPCKSWQHFMKRVDITSNEETRVDISGALGE